MRGFIRPSVITWVGGEAARLFDEILDLVAKTEGKLNFNDAFLVLLQRERRIGALATFDGDFDSVPGFERVAERGR